MIRSLPIALLLLMVPVLGAAADKNRAPKRPDLHQCHFLVASYFQLDPSLLRAIYGREGGTVGKPGGKNKNGTHDWGPMQINEIWFPYLERYGIPTSLVVHDECTNIMAGAWILANEFQRFRNWDLAIGAYNAGPSGAARATQYTSAVKNNWENEKRRAVR